MAKLVSKTYGNALFELAVEENKVDVLMEEIESVKSILEENKEFGRIMNHPKLLKEEKLSILETVFKGRVTDELTNFFSLIVTKDRYSDIDAILDYFLAEVKKYKDIGVAYITTALALKNEQKVRVEQKLLETTSYKKMEMHYSEDKSLIGGMVIRIGDRVVDSSIRTKLNELTRQLMQIQLS